MSKKTWIVIAALAAAVVAWIIWGPVDDEPVELPEGVTFLKQNWKPEERHDYYTRSQGSRMIPYAWMMALKRHDAPGKFMEGGLTRYGFLPYKVKSNPDGLPVGWVTDTGFAVRPRPPPGAPPAPAPKREKWLGLTCAACHTSQMRYKETTLQIDGGPTLGDFGAFMSDLDRALQATVLDPQRFKEFGEEVLGADFEEGKDALATEFTKFAEDWKTFTSQNTPSRSPWGRARVDAFGVIFNRISVTALGITANRLDPDAPVSYPFLWGTHDEDHVQWNADTKNGNDIERLGRNVGEALGVFGQVDVTRHAPWNYYRSSIRRINLLRLESTLKELRAPKWPVELFGALDPAKVAQGKTLYNDYCVRCHQVIKPGHERDTVTVGKIPVKGSYPDMPDKMLEACKKQSLETDPQMTRNNATRKVSTGKLKGAKFPIIGKELEETELVVNLVSHVGAGALLEPPTFELDLETLRDLPGAMKEVWGTIQDLGIGLTSALDVLGDFDSMKMRSEAVKSATGWSEGKSDPNPREDYKARPLDGIWATAPYLHNGSVPTLYHLLLPVEDPDPKKARPKTFYVGDPTFDPEHVGFVWEDASPSSTLFDTSPLPADPVFNLQDGNRNVGHVGPYYTQVREADGTWRDMTPEERWALVEYMKSL